MSEEFTPRPLEDSEIEGLLQDDQSFKGSMEGAGPTLPAPPSPGPLNDPDNSRITTIIQIYREKEGDPPFEFSSRKNEIRKGKEDPYIRNVTVHDDQKIPLDLGWVPTPCQVILENVRPWHPQTISKEDREKEDRASVFIDFLEVPVGMAISIYLREGSRVPMLDCAEGTARLRIHAISR